MYAWRKATRSSKNQKGRVRNCPRPYPGRSDPIYTATPMSIAPTNILRKSRIESDPMRINSHARWRYPIKKLTAFSEIEFPLKFAK